MKKRILGITLVSVLALTNFACSSLTPEEEQARDACLDEGGYPNALIVGYDWGGSVKETWCDFTPFAKTIHELDRDDGDYGPIY